MTLAGFFYSVPQAERELSQKGKEELYNYELNKIMGLCRLRKMFEASREDRIIDEVFSE